MEISKELHIPPQVWAQFKAWKPQAGIDPALHDWIRLRMQIHDFIRKCYRQERFLNPILELGSWHLVPGADFSYFKKKYDLYRTNISYGNGKAKLDFLLDAMDMKALGNETIGCVIATDVLEHLSDPFKCLREIYRVLKNGGHTLITVPFYFEIHGDDYFRFTPRGLEKALREAGFDDCRTDWKGSKPLNIQVVARKEKKRTLLFLGGGTRCSHIEQFRKKFRVIATDTRKDAPTRKLVDQSYITDSFSSPKFGRQLKTIIKREKVSAVLPASHYSIEAIIRWRSLIRKSGALVFMPSNKIARICLDKRQTGRLFKKIGLEPVPEISEKHPKFPLYFKSPRGCASKNVFRVENPEALHDLRKKYTDCILQKPMKGKEYTVDLLCDLEGRLLLAVPRLRLETGLGEIIKGKVIRHGEIIGAIRRLTSKIKFPGLVSVQCFEEDGKIYFSEINTRFGGGLSLSMLAGAPFVELLADVLEGKKPSYNKSWRSSAYFARAFRDFEVGDLDLPKMKL